MTLEVKSAVKNCKQCLCHDGDNVRAPLVPIEATGPMDLLHLDFTKIEVSGNCEKELKKKPKVVNILVVTDPLYLTHPCLHNSGYDCSYHGPCPVPPLLLHLWHSAVSYDG